MTIQLDSPGIERAEATPSADDTDLGSLFDQIRDLDAHILEAVKRRSELSQQIGAAAKESGETREAQTTEMGVLDRFAELGNDGKTLAMTLLRLGRTRRS
ncbi:chorismate mutase [Rhodococcus sp. NPDC060086]|uniref:chorismate mutase n=1 Tax=Rhodococcus sp. NPDC060086 TaxID=3347055 RepID=UPI00364FCB25